MKQLSWIVFLILFSVDFSQGASKLSGSENTLRIGLSGYPASNLFPLGYDEYSEAVSSLVLEPLIRLNLDDLHPESGLATLKISPRSWTRFEFEINPLAKFSDGHPVTAHDVCFTFDLLQKPHAKVLAYASIFKPFIQCEIKSTLTVVFHSKKPLFTAPQLISQLYILPKHFFSKKEFAKDFNDTYLGSGPYQFESVRWGHSIKLKKNPAYWANSLPQNKNKYQLEKVEFHIQSDPNALMQMLMDHQIDYLYFLSAKSWAKTDELPLFTSKKILKLEITNKIPFAQAGIAWNLRKPLFQEKAIRKALALLFNRKRLIRDFFFNQYELATGIAPASSEYHHPNNLPLLYDPAEAYKLLDQAGWTLSKSGLREKNGMPLKFELLTGHPPSSKIWAFYQEDLRKAGITLSIKIVDWATYIKIRNSGQFDALDFSRNRDELLSDLALTWHGSRAHDPSSGNVTGFQDARVDKLLDAISETPIGKKRVEMIKKIDLLIAEQMPMAFSWEPRSQRLAFWNQYSFSPPGFFQYSRWNQIFHFWKWCSDCSN